jgi:energy-coupling factor transport system permease protein
MQSFLWYPTGSYLHRLNPLTKLVLVLAIAAEVSTATEPLMPLAIAALSLVAGKVLGRLPWRVLARPWALAAVLSFGMFWTGALFYAGPDDGTVLLQVGPIHITAAGLAYGVTMAARLLAIFSASLIYVLTTDPAELVLALIQQARLPYKVGYAVFVAYRFMPLVQEEFENIRAAHRVRGVMEDGGVLGRLRRIRGYLIPLMAITVRRAERVALAMDARAFGALPERTYFRVSSFSRRDTIFAVCAAILLALPLALRVAVAQ